MSTTVNPYLTFNGNCAEAMRFYEKALGGKLQMLMTYGESPMKDQSPPETHKLIMHTTLVLGDDQIMASDCPPHVPFEGMKGMSVTLNYDGEDEAKQAYAALKEGAQSIMMELQPTFWAGQFAMLTDRFGTPWIINGRPIH